MTTELTATDQATWRSDAFLNREMSLLAFNRRVLEQARDTTVPILERLRFLCISSSNLDEFFEIRVAGLKQLAAHGSVQAFADNRSPQETLKLLSVEAHALVAEQYRVLQEEILPALAAQGIHVVGQGAWSPEQARWVQQHFVLELLPLLTPMGLDPAHPFPRILNKNLTLMIALDGRDAFGRVTNLAVLQVPRALPRLLILPPRKDQPEAVFFAYLSNVIQAHIQELFPGMSVLGCYQFRVTRNSELFVHEEEVEDLLQAVEGELSQRRYGEAVRLETQADTPPKLTGYLLRQFDIGEEDHYRAQGPVNLHRLVAIADGVDRPDLRYPAFTPGLPRQLAPGVDLFAAIGKQDILLHHPFESFAPVVEFIRQAACDPNVLAIRQTLYRTGTDSVIVDLLVDAAKEGKEVTAVIELRARFDEEANIGLATRLQEAGAYVVYGVVGYKTHAKMTLVVRREGNRLRQYVHLGTGNYHTRTSRLYTDYGLLTAHNELADDVSRVFLQLTSLGTVPQLRHLLQSPFTLAETLMAKIEREMEFARKGRPALIMAQLNGLTDKAMIEALYRASQAGVRIELIVRGMCCLRPSLPGISENISVRAILGRFLEHARVYYFGCDGKPEVYCASADWMERNLYKRVEVAFPILDPELRQRIIQETFDNYLADNSQSWILQEDGTYRRLQPGQEKLHNAQLALLQQLAERA
jgi:polyphosphate kinase